MTSIEAEELDGSNGGANLGVTISSPEATDASGSAAWSLSVDKAAKMTVRGSAVVGQEYSHFGEQLQVDFVVQIRANVDYIPAGVELRLAKNNQPGQLISSAGQGIVVYGSVQRGSAYNLRLEGAAANALCEISPANSQSLSGTVGRAHIVVSVTCADKWLKVSSSNFADVAAGVARTVHYGYGEIINSGNWARTLRWCCRVAVRFTSGRGIGRMSPWEASIY